MIRYPITSYPDLLTKEINFKSFIAECNEKPPNEPQKPIKQKTYQGCLIGFVFYIITAIVISGGISLSTSLPIGIALTVILWIVYSIIGQIEYYKGIRTYNADYTKYLYDIQIYNKSIEQIQNSDFFQTNGGVIWKNELKIKRLTNYNFKISSGYGKRGASEGYFKKQIEKFFDCQIFENPPIYCKNSGFKFYPDIVLLFEKFNIAIAIEIDEPYSLKDGKPIHYYSIEDGIPIFSDEEVFSASSRNVFTTRTREIINEGFILIKFAEEQVVLQPDTCCKYINTKIMSLFGLLLCREDLTDIHEIKVVNGWTYDEAKNMHRKRYRENYLKAIENFSDRKVDKTKYNDLHFNENYK